MRLWPRSEPDRARGDRSTLRACVVTAAAATGWAALAMGLGPHLVRSAHGGEGLAFLHRLVTERPLEEWLARWRVFAWSGMAALLSAGAFWIVATRPRPAWLVRFGPPALAFLLARSLLWVGFAAAPLHGAYGHRADGSLAGYATSFALRSWSRWDSHVYIAIAQRGYELYPCDIPFQGLPIASSGMWCGDTPWLPGYPALIWFLARVGVPEMVGGVAISALFCLSILLLVWTEILRQERTARSLLVLLLAALFPGAIYFHAIYPISVTTFFVLLSLLLVSRGRWVLAGLAGAAAAFSYPGAVFLGLVLPACTIYGFREASWPGRLLRAFGTGALVAAGVALVFAVEGFFVGTWDAFLRSQAQYDISTRMPILTVRPVLERVSKLVHTDWAHAGLKEWTELIVPVGVLFIAAIAVVVIAFAVRSWGRLLVAAPPSLPVVYLLIFLLFFWLVPLALPHYSLIRRHSLLLPAAPLAWMLPARILAPIVGLALLLVPVLGALYFSGILV